MFRRFYRELKLTLLSSCINYALYWINHYEDENSQSDVGYAE